MKETKKRHAQRCTCKMKVDTDKSVSVYFFRSKIREKGGKEMGKKGTPHRKWSKEEKRKISGQFSMPSHGDHRLARDVSLETGWVFSHNLAHKCCKAAGIHSRARKGRYRRTGEESIVFPNRVKGHWNAAAPLQLVVSDIKLERLTGNGPSSWIPSTTRSWLTVSHLKGEAISHSTTALNN